MPLSTTNFQKLFMDKIRDVDPSLQPPVKLKLPALDLEPVFGKDWNVFSFSNSQTRIRVLGNVDILFRRKKLTATR